MVGTCKSTMGRVSGRHPGFNHLKGAAGRHASPRAAWVASPQPQLLTLSRNDPDTVEGGGAAGQRASEHQRVAAPNHRRSATEYARVDSAQSTYVSTKGYWIRGVLM